MDRLRQWPGSEKLALNLGLTLDGALFTLVVERPEPYQEKLEEIYRSWRRAPTGTSGTRPSTWSSAGA